MSHERVGIVITRLLVDEELRIRFANDRVEALGELHARGFALTSNEIDLFLESDPQIWSWADRQIADSRH